MALRLTGKEVSARLAGKATSIVEAMKTRGVHPTLALVRVGERPDDLSYERTALKRAEALGIVVKPHVFPENVDQQQMEAAIREINADSGIHGCLMFRPLPQHLDEKALCDLLDVEKDIDGIGTASLASVFMDGTDGFAPCTAAACMEMLDYYDIALEGKQVAVIGRSLVVGKPLAMMMLARNATVTLCHSRTTDLPAVVQAADIVVCATGRAKAYGAEYFRPGQVVLDVGINFDEEGNLCGDVDYEAAEPIVEAITPVPGGVGGVTTTILMAHVAQSAESMSR